MPLETGLQGAVSSVVSDEDTALAVGSGDVPVLATPRLLTLAETATVRAVAEYLPAGNTTVGTRMTLDHHRPSTVGATLSVTAQVQDIDGRRIAFSFEARENDQLVAEGRVERAIIDRDRFVLQAKNASAR